MIPSQESAVRSTLASAGASKIRVEGTTLREVVQALYAEIKAEQKKVRLTWNSSPDAPDPSLVIGQLHKWKPYHGPIGIGKYFIQNMTVFYSNGQPVEDMTTISTTPQVERIVDGKGNFLREHTFPSDRQLVDNSLKSYMLTAIALDPNICKYCVQYSTADRMEYVKHLKRKHPQEFSEAMREEAEPEAEPAAEPISRKQKAATQ